MLWDWNAVSALISAVGVVGGLISLTFLVFEVRHNAKATEGGTVQSLMDLEVSVFELHANYAQLYLKGCSSPSALSELEAFQFDKLVSAQMSLYYSAYIQYHEGLISQDMWKAYLATLRYYLKRPGFAAIWKETEGMYPLEFRKLASAIEG